MVAAGLEGGRALCKRAPDLIRPGIRSEPDDMSIHMTVAADFGVRRSDALQRPHRGGDSMHPETVQKLLFKTLHAAVRAGRACSEQRRDCSRALHVAARIHGRYAPDHERHRE
jgi:hypothetical protein